MRSITSAIVCSSLQTGTMIDSEIVIGREWIVSSALRRRGSVAYDCLVLRLGLVRLM